MKTTTRKKTSHNANKPVSQNEFIADLFDLLDEVYDSGVSFRVQYDAEEDETIIISLGVNNPRVTRAAEAVGFTVVAEQRICPYLSRGAEAYLDLEKPYVVSAVREWMHDHGARVDADGRMAVEYQPEMPGN